MFPIPFNFPFRKKDGSMTTISQAISEGGGSYTLPTASDATKGGIKVGAGLTMDGETLNNTNPTPYALPTASAETLGGVKVGSGLSIDEGVLSASGGGATITKLADLDTTTTSVIIPDGYNFLFIYGYRGDSPAYHCEVLTCIDELNDVKATSYSDNIVFTGGGYQKFNNLQTGGDFSICVLWDNTNRTLTLEGVYLDTTKLGIPKLVVYGMK